MCEYAVKRIEELEKRVKQLEYSIQLLIPMTPPEEKTEVPTPLSKEEIAYIKALITEVLE